MTNPKILPEFFYQEINYLAADSNYTLLYMRNKKKLVSAYSLKVFAQLLAKHEFIRIDRSHLVNRSFISSVCDNGFIHLKNNTKLSIPRRKRAILFSQYPDLLTLTFNA